MYNYFEIFDIPESYNIDLELLRLKYFDLQRENHPDHNNRPKYDISLINKAYQILSNKIDIVFYILSLHDIKESNNKMEQNFLMQCMEWQENISNPDMQKSTIREVESKKKELLEKVYISIDSQNYQSALQPACMCKFLAKIY